MTSMAEIRKVVLRRYTLHLRITEAAQMLLSELGPPQVFSRQAKANFLRKCGGFGGTTVCSLMSIEVRNGSILQTVRQGRQVKQKQDAWPLFYFGVANCGMMVRNDSTMHKARNGRQMTTERRSRVLSGRSG
jgi:hypothetical protein